jgi:Tfp pilus assembly PilM family ATPase
MALPLSGLFDSGLLDDLRMRLRPLQARMFPQQVLLELRDDALLGQVLRNDRAQPLSIEAPLPAYTCRNGMPLEKEPLGDLIGDLLVRDGLLDAYVMAALPMAATEWRWIVWPFSDMPEDPAEALRQIDPPLHLTTPLDEAFIDLRPLPGQPAQMLLAVAPRGLVNAWIEVFDLAGAQLDRLAPAQSCQLQALQPLLQEAPEDQLIVVLDPQPAGPQLLLDPQPTGPRLLLVRAGLPVFERRLPAAMEPMVAELERCLAFYRRQDPQVHRTRLLLTAPFEDPEPLEQALGVEAMTVGPEEPFASLVLQGLAAREETP